MAEEILIVKIDKENFEYDVNSLVHAFYPGKQVKVLTPASRATSESDGLPAPFMEIKFEQTKR